MKLQTELTINGLSPDGDHPPDEVIHNPGENSTALLRATEGWQVLVYVDGSVESTDKFDDYGAAFARFVAVVETAERQMEAQA